jgi:hypothetical protein
MEYLDVQYAKRHIDRLSSAVHMYSYYVDVLGVMNLPVVVSEFA